MTNLFDWLKNITQKTPKIADTSDFPAFIVMRYLSFVSPKMALTIDSDVNRQMNNKQCYDYLYAIVPKCRINYSSYVKKDKIKKTDLKLIEDTAKLLELSKREVTSFLRCDEFKKRIKGMDSVSVRKK